MNIIFQKLLEGEGEEKEMEMAKEGEKKASKPSKM